MNRVLRSNRASLTRRTALGAAVLITSAGLIGALGMGSAQPGDAPRPAGAPGGARGGQGDLGQMLIEGLRNTEGCLGVDSGQFRSGYNTIVAWFENKAAVERWYHSEVHTRLVRMMGGDPAERTPLEHVENPDTPVMVLASIAFDGPPAAPGSPIPFSKISIELYTPLPGGAAVNGRFTPDAFPIPHFRRLDGAGG